MQVNFRFWIGSFWLFLGLVGCAAPRPVEPARAELESFVEEAETPQRNASMRLVDQGRKEYAAQRFERAAALFSRAVEIDSTNAFSYFYLGLVRLQASKFGQARDLFQRAGDLFQGVNTWKAEAYAYAGECCEKLNRPDQARSLYAKARDFDAGNSRAQSGASRLGL